MTAVYCPNCGREIEENAAYCPFCGAKLEETPAQPPTAIKRHVSITLSVILLCIFFLVHILNMIGFLTEEDLAASLGQLFFGMFALVAAYFLWHSKGIGGVIGIMYAILSTISSLSLPFSEEIEYSVYGIIFDVCFNIVLIILIVIGRKSLKFGK